MSPRGVVLDHSFAKVLVEAADERRLARARSATAH
jgi:hypothetical protein